MLVGCFEGFWGIKMDFCLIRSGFLKKRVYNIPSACGRNLKIVNFS